MTNEHFIIDRQQHWQATVDNDTFWQQLRTEDNIGFARRFDMRTNVDLQIWWLAMSFDP